MSAVHLDNGAGIARCNWKKAAGWVLTSFLADVTCKRCKRLGLPSETPTQVAPAPPAEDDREAWLAWRREGLGGSDMAAILGLSPWSTPFDVWLAKVEGHDIGDSRAMWMGRHLEPAVAAMAAEHYGIALVPASPMVSARSPIVRGTADSLMADGAGLEVKTTRDRAWEAVPLHYEVQVRWYMEVYDLDVWRVACLHAGTEPSFWELRRDRRIGQAMVDRAIAWWATHIIGGLRPPLEGRQVSAYLHREHRHSTGLYIVEDVTSEAAGRFARWEAAGRAIAQLEAQREADGLWLREHIGDAKGLQVAGQRLDWSRYDRRQTDWRSLKADPARARALDELTAPFTTTTTTGRLIATLET